MTYKRELLNLLYDLRFAYDIDDERFNNIIKLLDKTMRDFIQNYYDQFYDDPSEMEKLKKDKLVRNIVFYY